MLDMNLGLTLDSAMAANADAELRRQEDLARKAAQNQLQATTDATTALGNVPVGVPGSVPANVPRGGSGPSAYGVSGPTGQASMRGSGPYGMDAGFASRLAQANAAMEAAGLGRFGITDGFRSYAAQVDVKRRKPNLAATPGRSVHGTGFASDIDANRRQQEWLRANGARFGIFAPIYRKEPWHWQSIPGWSQRQVPR